jgi:hypothetical protein
LLLQLLREITEQALYIGTCLLTLASQHGDAVRLCLCLCFSSAVGGSSSSFSHRIIEPSPKSKSPPMSLICIAPDIHCPLFKTVCRKKGNEKWRGKACIAHRTDRPTKFSSWRQAHRRRSSRLWLRRFVVCTASLNAGVGTHPASSMAGAAHLTGGNTQPPKKVGPFERDACGRVRCLNT